MKPKLPKWIEIIENNLCVSGTNSANVYKDANEKIERFSEIFAYVLGWSAVILLLPPLLYTVVNYYVLDSGKESFILFFPAWFVDIY